MTEHERRVNDKDIKAYEEVNRTQLNSMMIPGLGNHYNYNQKAYMFKGLQGNTGVNANQSIEFSPASSYRNRSREDDI